MPQNLEAIIAAGPHSGLVRPLMSRRTKLLVCFAALIVLCTDVEADYSVASMAVSALVRNACATSMPAQRQEVRAVASISAAGEVSVACTVATPLAIR